MVNGFCMMSIEMVASKILAPYFGNSIGVWGSIISIFMLSLAVGAITGGWISSYKKQINILLFMLIGLVLSLIFILLVEETFLSFIDSTSLSLNIKMLLSCSVLFIPFSFMSGMITPFSIQLLSSSNNTSGLTAGRLYFLSTIASGVGVIVTSFYLVIVFTVESIFIMNIAILVALVTFFILLKKYHPIQDQDLVIYIESHS